ncbi:glyoxalase [Salipaludibacillus keqinensis]|uniref:Glyoxalase n=1 Tax=Salipaludibacillus keqinensis TaxID=2045207 RepID=A0A323TRK0_9BACI|nr:VOC family protein [Salipaludibacillus keqinensis]PYZ91985.1 glyoxalase [Salipaludibacillus keqinensis]
MIIGLAHVAITVKYMDRSLYFYRDILGLKHAFHVNDQEGNPWIEYVQVGPQQFIELFHGGKNESESVDQQIGFHHLCIRVADIHEIANHLTSHGISLDVAPKKGVGKNYQCWVKDPDGNRIEFLQPEEGSPHMAE